MEVARIATELGWLSGRIRHDLQYLFVVTHRFNTPASTGEDDGHALGENEADGQSSKRFSGGHHSVFVWCLEHSVEAVMLCYPFALLSKKQGAVRCLFD